MECNNVSTMIARVPMAYGTRSPHDQQRLDPFLLTDIPLPVSTHYTLIQSNQVVKVMQNFRQHLAWAEYDNGFAVIDN